ncbi:hypothetical protein E4U13_002767 [Claviceps humidiphila]|uniref:Uncharacterized protein n=1 Tax=Claviceps humidiphila TaxID=1294629 RepID=A0A9P7PYF0_9HYPO|nr:hypothetical protein E4U13_002767 [Claviceps humidiphila]
MAHIAQSAGATGDAVPMDIDSGTRGLAQSCHHPLSGLGSINVEAVGTEAITVRERVPKLLIAEYEKMARLVTPPALEGVWEVCLSIFNIGATNPQRHAQNNNNVTTENLEKSIEKACYNCHPGVKDGLSGGGGVARASVGCASRIGALRIFEREVRLRGRMGELLKGDIHGGSGPQLSTRDYVYDFKKRLPYRLQTHLAATPVDVPFQQFTHTAAGV